MRSLKLTSLAVMLCILLAVALPALVLDRDKSSGPSYEALNIYISQTGESRIMSLEEYTAHVCVSLAGQEAPLQMARALAIVARTRVLLYANKACRGDYCTCPEHSLPYDDDVPQQVAEAVNSTAGEVIVAEGSLVPAFVHKSSYLATSSAYELLGKEISCLVSVSSPENAEEKEIFIPRDEFVLVMQIKLGFEDYSYGDEILPDRGSTGRIKQISVKDSFVSGEAFASAMGAESTNISLEKTDGGYNLSFRGCGDGLGLSIEGAREMARKGSDAKEILSHYYQGCRIERVYDIIR